MSTATFTAQVARYFQARPNMWIMAVKLEEQGYTWLDGGGIEVVQPAGAL